MDIKKSLIDSLEMRGRHLRDVVELDLAGGDGAMGTLKAFTSGSVTADRLLVLAADGPHGPECVVQPLAGKAVLPGEYHLSLPGALRGAAEFAGGSFLRSWTTRGDDDLAAFLEGADLGAHELPTSVDQGLTKIELPWIAQLFPVAGDRSALVFAVGGTHMLLNVADHARVADRIAARIGGAIAEGPALPLSSPSHSDLAAQAARGSLGALLGDEAPRIVRSPAERVEAITAVLRPHVSKRVHVGELPSKVAANVTKKVTNGRPEQIVAFLDTGLRASGKAGFAFTPEAVHISEIGERWSIAYDDIRSFDWTGRHLQITTRLDGVISPDASGVENVVPLALEAATGLGYAAG